MIQACKDWTWVEMINIWNMNESDFQVEVDCDQWMIMSVIEEKIH